MINIGIASDLSGFPLKKSIVEYLRGKENISINDFGIESEENPEPYFIQAPKVAESIQSGSIDRGILICGTGQGMAIVANKFKGVYAAVVTDIFSGERCKIINNANVITLGGWITAPFVANEIIDGWLNMEFLQKMEFKRDFLTNAFNKVKELEDRNFL